MRAVKFIIRPDELKFKNHNDFPNEDVQYIIGCANALEIQHYTCGAMYFVSKNERLFTFLMEVAERYDIEII